MNTQNRKTARRPLKPGGWYLGATALCLVVLSLTLWSCGSPVGGTESNPIEFFVGKEYKGQWENFSISREGENIILKIGSGQDDTIGKIMSSRAASHGTVYLLECRQHKNWGNYQYPDYNERNPHSGCLTLVHVRSINSKNVEWATFYTKVSGKDTSCFASTAKAKAKEYLDFTKWDSPYAYSTGSAQN